ncbi:MAG: hypothetical protein VYA30_06330 [Myxococcota bacterium]|nr:hypothetical protein [Myxococcota bacterium]
MGSDPLAPNPNRLLVPLGEKSLLTLSGATRFLYQTLDNSGFDSSQSQGPTADTLKHGETRLRLQPTYYLMPSRGIRLVKLSAELEFNWRAIATPNLLAEADSSYASTSDALFALNQAYSLIAHEYFVAMAGLTRSEFGLGLLANGGIDGPVHSIRTNPYGGRARGDRNMRVQVAYLPFGSRQQKTGVSAPLALTLLGDRVYKDDSTDWEKGDETTQYGGGLFGTFEGGQFGAVVLHRQQVHQEGGETSAMAYIGTFSYDWAIEAQPTFFIDAEGAILDGTSTLSQSVLQPDAVDVLSTGGVVRVGMLSSHFDALFETGYASGDDNAFDRRSHNFRFDSGFRAGSFLFSSFIRAATAVSASNVADENYRASPPRGFEKIPTGGAIENSLYLNPRLQGKLMDNLSINFSYLYARAAAPWVDPYQSGLNGGVPTGPSGSKTASILGHEYTAGMSYSFELPGFTGSAQLWYAQLHPGNVFDSAAGQSRPQANGFGSILELLW